MNKSLHLAHWLLIIIVIVSLIATAHTAVTLWQSNKINHFISNVSDYEQVPEHPMAQFAQAFNDVKQDKQQQALDRLTQIVATEDVNLKTAIYFNRGNIHLREAQAMLEDDPARLSVVELAKQDYRTALLLDSSLWNVRFNLELALKMVPEEPEPDSLFDKSIIKQQKSVQTIGFRVDLP